MKQFLLIVILLSAIGIGGYFAKPYLGMNTKPKNWQNGQQGYVPARLKNTLNGLGKGF